MMLRLCQPPKSEVDHSQALHALAAAINAWLETSRFRARVEAGYHPRWKRVVRLDTVRCRQKKSYCGQHPNECVVTPFKRERSGTWLEGLDWVGFNDGLNDLLDRLGVDAEVWSFNREADRKTGGDRYFIRRGRHRRVDYQSHVFHVGMYGEFHAWTVAGNFEDWVGKEAPRSEYPEGTPGTPDWRPGTEVAHED